MKIYGKDFKPSICEIGNERIYSCVWQQWYLNKGFVMARNHDEGLRWTKRENLKEDEEVYVDFEDHGNGWGVDYVHMHNCCPLAEWVESREKEK